MKHTHAFLRKEFSKIRDEITRNYVLNTLTKSDEELQQQNTKPYIDTHESVRIIDKKRYIAIDTVLGADSNPARQEGENQT